MSGCSWLDDLDLEASMADCAASIQHDVVQSAAADRHLSSLHEVLGPGAGADGQHQPPLPLPQQPAMPHWPAGHPPPQMQPLMAAGHPDALAQQQQQQQQLLQDIVYARSPDSLLAATTSYMELMQSQQAAASHINGPAGAVAAQPEAVLLQPGGQQELYAALTAALEAVEPAVALQHPGDVSAGAAPADGTPAADAMAAGWNSNQFAWPAAAPATPSMPAAWAADAAAAAHAGLGSCAPILRCHSAMAALGNDGGAAAQGAGSSCSSSNDHNSTWGMTPAPVLFRALSEPLCTTAVAGKPVAEPGLTSPAAALQAQQLLPVALAELRQPQLKPHLKFRGTPAAAAGCQTQEGLQQAPGTLRVSIKCFKPPANRLPPPPPVPAMPELAMPELDDAGREQRRRLQHQARLRHYAKLLKLLDARLKPAAKAKTKAKRKPVYC